MALDGRHDPAAAAAVANDGWIEAAEPVPPPTGTNAEPKDASGATVGDMVEADTTNEPPRDPRGRFERPGFRNRSHRAQSQQAGPEDVPRIQELTRRLRETERERDELRNGRPAPTTEAPTPGHAPIAAARPEVQAEPVQPASQSRRVSLPPEPKPFTLKEPTFEEFKDSADPLRDYTKAMAKFTHAEEQHALAVKYHQQETQRAAEADDTELQGLYAAHVGRMQTAASDPATKALFDKAAADNRPITPAMMQAIVRSGEQSHALTIALLKNDALLDELALATYDRPATPDLVALVQRRLTATGTAQAAALTGSAASPAPRPAPRPPNPVRTAPEAPPRELPGDDASWEEHRAAFHKPQLSRIRR